MKNFLVKHPCWSEEQLKIFNSRPGVFVNGSAGTGKTLLATHIAIKRNTSYNESVIIVVQTKSLVAFIKHLINEINPNALIDVEYDFNVSNRYNDIYDILIIDEIYDFGNKRVEELRKLARKGVYIFGDKEQVLSSFDKSLKPLNVSKLSFYSEIKFFKLNQTYRVPLQTLNFIKEIYKSKTVKINHRITDELPMFYQFSNINEELCWIAQYVCSLLDEKKFHSIGILLSINDRRQSISTILSSDSVPFFLPGIKDVVDSLKRSSIKVGYKYSNSDYLDFSSEVNVNVLTIHSSKGLEFDHVIIPFACLINYDTTNFYNNMLYVASTRSSGSVVYSYSRFVSELFNNDLIKKNYYKGLMKNYKIMMNNYDEYLKFHQNQLKRYLNGLDETSKSNLNPFELKQKIQNLDDKYKNDKL